MPQAKFVVETKKKVRRSRMHLQSIVRTEHVCSGATFWPQILLYGLDHELLRIRGLLLASAARTSNVVVDLSVMLRRLRSEPHLRLAVLCHTTPADDRRAIEDLLQEEPLAVPLYCLPHSVPPAQFLAETLRLIETGKSNL